MISTGFPAPRLRRMRKHVFSRQLIQEYRLDPADFLFPIIFHQRSNFDYPIKSMPGQSEFCLDGVLRRCELCCERRIPGIVLMLADAEDQGSSDVTEVLNPEGAMPRMIQQIKSRFPNLGIISETSLHPYLKHGNPIGDRRYLSNDQMVRLLCQHALIQAQAGADMVAPCDMTDGCVGEIRKILDKHSLFSTAILAYSVIYDSAYCHQKGTEGQGSADCSTSLLDPANRFEALREALQDSTEGADMLMVKPGGQFLDVIAQMKSQCQLPIVGFQASGEYGMIKAAAEKGWLNETDCMLESLVSLKRAGCSAIVTYFATDAAMALQ